SNASLVAVADNRADVAASFAQEYGVPKWYECHRDLLNDKDVAAVAVITPTSAAMASKEKIVLAARPFEDLSHDQEQDYFSDGLTEEMITQLARLNPQQLSVIARTSSMRYKGSSKRIREIATELGANY